MQKASSILSGAGYHPVINRDSVEVYLNGSGEENFVYNKLRKAGIVLQEGYKAPTINKDTVGVMISKLQNTNHKGAQFEWEAWSSGYAFDLETADSYDLANARRKANAIFLKFGLKEAKLKEDILADVLGTPDPHARYKLIYEGIQSNRITFEEFVQIAGALQSGESFTFMNDEVDVTPEKQEPYFKRNLGLGR